MALALFGLLVLVIWLLVGWLRSTESLRVHLLQQVILLYARLWHGCHVERRAPLPASGAALILVNHTCSADAMFVQTGCTRPLTFLFARKFYDDLPPFRWVFRSTACVCVNRDSRDVRAARESLQRLHEGRVVCIFPEGDLSGATRKRLRPGKSGAAWLALRSNVPVIPAFIWGGPQTNDIATAWLCPSRGVHITFGSAIDLTAFRGRKMSRQLVEEVRRYLWLQVAALDQRGQKRV